MASRFLEQFLPDFYHCAEQPARWSDVLDKVRDEMDVGSVVIQKFRLNGNRLQQEWVLRDSLSLEHAESHDTLVNNEDNPRLELDDRRLALQDVEIFRTDVIPRGERVSAFRDLEQRLAMLGLASPIILGIKYADDCRLSMLLHPRLGHQDRIGERHGVFLQQLAPHLKQTVSLFEKLGDLQQANATLGQSMDQLSAGVVILNAAGEVQWLNDSANALLGRTRHLSLAGRQLRCATADDARVLAEVIASGHPVRSSEGHVVGTLGNSWEQPVQVLALPVQGPRLQCVALYLCEHGMQVELSAEDVVRLYGLTPAEARLAIALCEGMTLNEYAEAHGKSVGTVRIQLKSIFSKLGISRQPELVRIIGNAITTRTRLPGL